jgi:alpha-tubulin suppressor-like RCC1 family protein
MGTVKCWGDNQYGQLGNGRLTGSTRPVDVWHLTGVVSISAGNRHTCALTEQGGVKCWGQNTYGQLGIGTTTHAALPVDVVDLQSDVTAISAGTGHTCAVTNAGSVKCWGSNAYGRLGNDTHSYSPVPTDVVGLDGGVAAVSAGTRHTCVLTMAGGIRCWGANDLGQLGNGTTADSPRPVDVVNLTNAIGVAVNGRDSCAVTTAGRVLCWGSLKYWPVEVDDLTRHAVAISLGGSHACVLTTAGGMMCWGSNYFGQVGNEAVPWNQPSPPVDVLGLTGGVTAISAGEFHTCALTAAGGMLCWGYNNSGQLGDSSTTNGRTPVAVWP